VEFQHTQLSNGLNVIAEIAPTAATMAAGFFVKTGSRDETPDVAGVSHFLEHMMFKGTARRSAMDVNLDFDRMGANYNAFTSEEYTVYFAAVLPEFQARMLDLLGDMMRPALREEDFDVEKNVILEEIAMYRDRPQSRLFEKLMAQYFEGHPLGNSVLGTSESITALRRDAMCEYFDRRYSPGNVTAVGVGRIDFDAFVAEVDELCSAWPPRDAARDTPPAPGVTAQRVLRDAKVTREHIGLMSSGPAYQDAGRYAAQLAAAVVGDATGSRLFYALIEPALADEAWMAYEPLDQVGAMLTFLSTDPDRAEQALQVVRDVLAKFAEAGPTPAELQAAKNKIASSATLKGEVPMGRLTAVGFDWTYHRQYLPLDEHIEALLAVTGEQVLDVVRRHDLTSPTVLGLGPLEQL